MTKLFYKIGEVCDITGLKPTVLRFWEKEFRQLRPTKSSGGQRLYTEKHIELAKRLKVMLYDEKFTIEGVKKKLAESEDYETGLNKEQIKSELNNILKLLNS
ncbi:transcriptional regulator, MerR family [Denitrovibrio acetiphilus DSM 12809]|uniref:Transcriptional regulator, MerR family n=1 Tax=Denitrovibrio acetiphilus (strain DSM 12809 / NBRC 114555 / N2460) TaxID=522772 RepID=D4H7H8_DENA2|nr:MerR family transcriptional regulator [Denitrovibrio acetiphilus]ADD67977.1 transcriptional regulator, MerR family [Denitrovibrio acetiphilus DSM 12809]